MKIYNKEKTKELLNYDSNKGYLIDDKIIIGFSEEQLEKSHYETIAVYDNGGKEIKKVIDQEYKPKQPIYEDIKVFIPYTNIELANNEYNELVNWFNTEYTKLEQKYRRLHTLHLLTDNGYDPYNALLNLYEDAEIRRRRIKELEAIIYG